MRLICCAAVACFAILVASEGALRASIVSVNDTVFGTDSITRDTATGLDWLDLTKEEASLSDYSDFIHPSRVGHRRLAERLCEEMPGR